MEKLKVSSNIVNNRQSYKHFHKPFRKNTDDVFVGTKSLESWNRKSINEYCINHLEQILKSNDYTYNFRIPKWFLKFFECNGQMEFEDKVLIPILRKLCNKDGLDFEKVIKKIFRNECISYEENFN